MRTDESFKLFYDGVVKKASEHRFIEEPVLSRKEKDNHRTSVNYFQIDGHDYNSEENIPTSAEDECRTVFF